MLESNPLKPTMLVGRLGVVVRIIVSSEVARGSRGACEEDAPAAKNLSPSLDSCCQAILRDPVFVLMFSSTWGNPEVGGGDNFLGF